MTPTARNDQIAPLILILAILLGAWIRLTPASIAGFPLNDGGMFYSMIKDLQLSGYSLPVFTSYNQAEHIPFAYPPFPLYLAGFLSSVFHLSITSLLLWLPAVVSITVIPVFYLLAARLLAARLQASLATLLFSLTPRTFSWFLMGGGLTRSFGQLFLMLTAISAYQLFTSKKRGYLVSTAVLGALAVLSHPEAAVHTVGIVLLIWLFKARTRAAFLDGILVALGVFTITGLWWLPVLSQNGFAPFINALQTGDHTLSAWIPLLTFNFTEEPLVQLIAVLGLIGLFVTIRRRDYFFAAWFVVPFIMEPRSATWILTMPLAMAAAITLTDLLLPGLTWLQTQPTALAGPTPDYQGRAALVFLGCITTYSLLGSYAFALKMGADHLNGANVAAMNWVGQNTPPGSRFIVLTGAPDPMNDPVQEWFPALTGRESLTTMQGREWTWGRGFIPAIASYADLQSCMTSNFACFARKAQSLGIKYGFIYFSIPPGADSETDTAALISSVSQAIGNPPVYAKDGVYIFQTSQN